MNRIYRVIWNSTLRVFQVCSELTNRQGKSPTVNQCTTLKAAPKLRILSLTIMMALSGSAVALTVDGGSSMTIDSAVTNDGYLIGVNGQGTLNIIAGGVASYTGTATNIIGGNAGSQGTVNVIDGGQWSMIDGNGIARLLQVGQGGAGRLNISAGGIVTAGSTTIGATGSGDVDVRGAGSEFNTGSLAVGSSGAGTLSISDNALVKSQGAVDIGISSGNGIATVDNGQWTVADSASNRLDLQVGGNGTLNILNGGQVTAGATNVGFGPGANGKINVQGAGSVLNTDSLVLGMRGNAELNISDYGLVNSTKSGSIGLIPGVSAVANVTDHGHWVLMGTNGLPQDLSVGVQGSGLLNINTAGVVDAGILTMGYEESGRGEINVKDQGSELNTNGMRVGFRSEGIVNISDDGRVSSTGANALGYFDGVTGTINVTSGGEWDTGNILTSIGLSGTGNLNVNTGGKVLGSSTTVVGDMATGVGTVNLEGANVSMETLALLVGNYGTGALNVSDSAKVSSTSYGLLGYYANSKGRATITTNGEWKLADSAGVGQTLYIGNLGEGEMTIDAGGSVTAGDTFVGTGAGGSGTILVDGSDSLLQVSSIDVGLAGQGMLTLTNAGTLDLTGSTVKIASMAGSKGEINIGAAHGETAASAGFITHADSIIFGAGDGSLVFNHTDVSDTGYQVDALISGATGAVVHDAGHTVFNAANTYGGKTDINDGILTVASHANNGVTGLGSSEVNIATPGTLEITAASNTNGDYTLTNALSGDGLLRVRLDSADKTFAFAGTTGSAYSGTVQLKESTFQLAGDNTTALAQAMLQTDTGNTTKVGAGTQNIGGLAFNGGTLVFDTSLPASTLAAGAINTDTLIAGAGTYNWNGREQQVNGEGVIKVAIADPWNDPMAANPDTTLNLLQQDDTQPAIQLIHANNVIGSGGSLTLSDMDGNAVGEDKTLQIAQNGAVVADGDYGFRLTTAPGDGLYVNYGLKALNIHAGQTLILAEHAGDTGAAADMSAKIGGEGNLGINSSGLVSLSNGLNDYKGATLVLAGTLRTDADGALGDTSELNISSGAATDLNGTAQTAGMLTGQSGSLLALNGGSLTLENGGISQGDLTGAGNLNVAGGTLTIDGANGHLSAATSISGGAEVVLNDVLGAGTGTITNDGKLILNAVTGELLNSISGAGIVDATAATDIALLGDNSGFNGLLNIENGSAVTLSEQKHLGTAAIADSGLLTVNTNSDWTLENILNGDGDLAKRGTGKLTLNQDSAGYSGTTDIFGGELALGTDAASTVAMASSQVNIHEGAVMSGFVSTAGHMDVMQGGTLQVSHTTVGGNLENSGTVLMNRSGAQPGNQLSVNGNYNGNNGLIAFNTTLNGDNSPTDKMTVAGDTDGNTKVVVNNVGGVGAKTVNGIELVHVDGASAGHFALTTGTVEAGAYAYTLAKGEGGNEKNWYLTSQWQGGADVDPVIDPKAPHALRPEAGSYLSNLAVANSLFNHRLHDRLGEPQYTDALRGEGDSATSLWLRQVGGHERSSAGNGQLKTQGNRYVVQLGGDLVQWSSDSQDRWHVGAMLGYANEHSHTRSNRVGYGSDGRVSGYSAGLYGTWYQNDTDKTGAYVDTWALYNWFDNNVKSDNRESDDYHSRGVTASIETGYTFETGTFSGSEGTLNTWYVQPQAQVTWMGVKDSDHSRQDGTRIQTEGDGNIQTRLGVKTYLNSHHKRDDGKQREFQPYVEANWIYNSEAYGVKMDGQKVSRDGVRNLGEVRTGVEAKLNNNLTLWGNVGVQIGDKGYSDTQGMLGVKYGW
ncbi:lipoprotein/autotransporter domain-containing protein [[Enterobacter] lignolyticus]|uniref:Lipoprotein/autotransporter domain-containing protein n=1 Tax=[Enterobacter] lignolyticus TaxID=1334193 RepID=A0A806XJ27_9ENTR|nr:autotransporter outer membrane beta-barrel domain-containing protein [[Enterobacter] lignolyticus]ALR78681.1 lipoprotein/autotransporter domain-containing protein [[Enterobacter] lignolyticus]